MCAHWLGKQALLFLENTNLRNPADGNHLDFQNDIKEVQIRTLKVHLVLPQSRVDLQLAPDNHLALKQKEMFSKSFQFFVQK